jgi:phosphate starvation-inducible PhoH-like protein
MGRLVLNAVKSCSTLAAIEALEASDVRRIILVRPAVEAGEKLGFLPGDMNEKIDPYLRPIYDAQWDG